MIRFKFIFRKLWRDRFFTFLKILGLAIGIATCLVVFKIVHYEFSFDKKQPGKEDIYQVVIRNVDKGKEYGFGGIQLPLAAYVKDELPDIAQVVPVNNVRFENLEVERKDGEIYRKEDPWDIQRTVPEYFEMVPYHWLAGDKNTALSEPYQAVLTASRAKQYFGNISPHNLIGRTIRYNKESYTIKGIVADLDFPSSFSGKEFIPISKDDKKSANWLSFNSNYNLFVKLQPNQKDRLLKLMDNKYAEMSKEVPGMEDVEVYYKLLPLQEKHFSPEYSSNSYASNKNFVFGLIGLGVFILLLAGINYINLSTAQVPYRTKEIGVRKTLGEKSSSLTGGFLAETLIICLIATLFAFPLARGFESAFQDFMPPHINDYSFVFPFVIFIIGLLIVLTALTGLYPAYLINKVNVSKVLQVHSSGKLSLGNLNLRKAMIVFQFVIAQVFVIGAFIMASQISYMLNADLGFDKEAVITLKIPTKDYRGGETDPFLLKQALRKHPEIREVALGHTPMNNMMWGNSLVRETDTGKKELNMNFKYVDEDYVDLFDLKMEAGRKPELRDTVNSVFINEAARIRLGYKTNEGAIGQVVRDYSGEDWAIRGVLANFYQRGLQYAKEPLAILVSADKSMLLDFNIKLNGNPSQWQKDLQVIEKEWKNYYPNAAFDYSFYDTSIEKLYQSDLRQSKMVNLATIVTIILGCLGLIGLVTLTAYQRTKEIGIRKVLGSSIWDVVMLLSKDYLKLIGWAILISIPIAWWALHKWLENFANRIEIKWWMFVITGIATILIALLSVSYRAIKAARANPVDSLRDE